MVSSKVVINGIDFKNPVITASGTFGFGQEYNEIYDVSSLGGISSKGLTINPKEGNDGPRVVETRAGMMNSVGLQNPGIDVFISNELPGMKKLNTRILANLGGATIEDYINGTLKLNDTDVDIIELNISCPNVKCGGMALGIKAETAADVVRKVKEVSKKPLMVKLSPNAESIVKVAVACEEAGADSLSLVNTFKGMAIDIRRKAPVFKNVVAGLSGPAIKPIALSMVYEVAGAVNIPVIGMGGITTWEDAIEFIMAGSTAIQVGTANFIKPDAALDIVNGIEEYMNKEGIKSLEEIRGIARR
ncbi:dihydroorotate dehydrogenase B (NAD(+)), catalytic subunit [Clostridium cylindrosporum DSM 605]|uniref:Dihydroorotate dehydrogenase n=1 Tax=Clostridium cylindrosporum DSM 605 TaxID=1121307 RepID=A0A0J8G6Q7_CLOCY|nr:dihydroorotate dehydrogenase B (NAD(+)), catalytic subunit [Clostridium cylindrosporum DSM 605]